MHVTASRVASVKPSVKRPPAMQSQQQQSPGKCQFWLEKKRRFCKMTSMPGHRFCGNHFDCSVEGGPKRIVCPYDPIGGHTVLESELEKHKPRCPAYKLLMEQKAQPFYREGINEGTGPDAHVPEAPQEFADRKGRTDSAAAKRAAYAAGMGPEGFARLLARIEEAYQQLCGEPAAVSVLCSPQAEPYMKEDGIRPFSLKHATQQASIVGNMEQEGLLEGAASTTYLEFGAGKGFLSAMLADCSGAQKLVMMDVRGFQGKADRVLRHLQMQRLRCDIKDFDVRGVKGLESGAAPWVGIGKHLCGAATDFTLRCCARERQAGHSADGGGGAQPGQSQSQQQQAGDANGATAAPGEGAAGAAEAAAAAAAAAAAGQGLHGLAIATCCHHRCSWRHYVGQEAFLQAGFSPEAFEVVSWMTGWALCGHEAPAGFGGEAMSEDEDAGGGGSGGGTRVAQQTAATIEAGAVAAAAAAPGPAVKAGGGCRDECREQGPAKRQHLEPAQTSSAVEVEGHSRQSGDKLEQQQQVAGVAAGGAAEPAPRPGAGAAQQGVAAGPGSWRPHHSLSRAERIAVGQKCKRLLDAGRLLWLRQQGFRARFVTYVPAEVSGENQLLLATTTGPP